MCGSEAAVCAASAMTCKPMPAIIHTAPYPMTNRNIARALRCAKLRSRTCLSGTTISGGVMAASISNQPDTNARLNESDSGICRAAEQRPAGGTSLQVSTSKVEATRLVATSHESNLELNLASNRRMANHITRLRSIGLPEHAYPADADLGLGRHRVARHQQHVQLLCLDRAGQMQPVDDVGNIQDVGQSVASVLVVSHRRLAHAEQRNAARQMVGIVGGIFAFGYVDIDVERGRVADTAHILQVQENTVGRR